MGSKLLRLPDIRQVIERLSPRPQAYTFNPEHDDFITRSGDPWFPDGVTSGVVPRTRPLFSMGALTRNSQSPPPRNGVPCPVQILYRPRFGHVCPRTSKRLSGKFRCGVSFLPYTLRDVGPCKMSQQRTMEPATSRVTTRRPRHWGSRGAVRDHAQEAPVAPRSKNHPHIFSIADDDAVDVLVGKLGSPSGSRTVDKGKLMQALSSAVRRYNESPFESSRAFYHGLLTGYTVGLKYKE
jgi:hypothetical protein